MRTYAGALGLMMLAGLAGCSSDGQLMTFGGTDGPDEFAIVPTRPLQMPADPAVLPPPAPGGSNITDPQPKADAVASLGGNPAILAAQGVGAADAGLLAYTARMGRDANIRAQTATEDEAFRARHGRRLLEVVAKTNVYMRAYRPMAIDPWDELERFRRAGVRTPSAPPRANP